MLAELRAYVPAGEREGRMRRRIIDFVERHPRCFERALEPGHLTGSAWIVDADGGCALLLHHRKLGRWLQPGGHADGDADLRRVALREAREETGLRSLRFAGDAIYDLDVHAIPARANEPAHDHHDIRFAFFADPDEPVRPSDEARDARWVPLDSLADFGVDESVLRLASKTAGLTSARSHSSKPS